MSEERLDLNEVRRLLVTALENVDALNGQVLPGEDAGTRERNRATAALSRELLFIGHICRKAEVLTLDAYQSARGYAGHLSP